MKKIWKGEVSLVWPGEEIATDPKLCPRLPRLSFPLFNLVQEYCVLMNLLLINFEKNCDRSKIKAKLSAAASTTIETGVFTLHQHSFSWMSIVAIFSSFPIMPCRPSNAIQIDGRSLELIDGKRGQSAWTKLIGKSRIGEMCQTICWKDLPQISKWRNKRFQQIWSYGAVDWFRKIMWQKNTCIR